MKQLYAGLCTCVIAVVGLAALAPAVSAQDAPRQTTEDRTVVTRVYEVSDLSRRAPDFPAPRNLLEQPSARPIPLPPAQQILVNGKPLSVPSRPQESGPEQASLDWKLRELVPTIQGAIEPDSWRDTGGAIGSVRVLGDNLIITHTPQTHEQIGRLLEALRTSRGGIVRIRADWLLLKPEQLASILEKNPATATLPDVNREALSQLPADAYHYRGETVAMNHQTVHLGSGLGRTVLTDLDPVVANGAAAYDPQIEMFDSGVLMQVTPTVIQSAGVTLLDLEARMGEWGPGAFEQVPMGPATQPAGPHAIERVSQYVQRLATTVRVPLGKPVLVGGMTMRPSLESPDSRQLYLVLQADAASP